MSMWELSSRMDLISSPDRSTSRLATESGAHAEKRSEKGAPHYNAAYLAARPGEKYFLYFPYGDVVDLSLSGHPGRFKVRWIDVNTGEWGAEASIEGGDSVALRPPDSGGWLAAIVRE